MVAKPHNNTDGAWAWIDRKFGSTDFGTYDVDDIVETMKDHKDVNLAMRRFLESQKPGVLDHISKAKEVQTFLSKMTLSDYGHATTRINELPHDIFKKSFENQRDLKKTSLANSTLKKIEAANKRALDRLAKKLSTFPDDESERIQEAITARKIELSEDKIGTKITRLVKREIPKIDTYDDIKTINTQLKEIPKEKSRPLERAIKQQRRKIWKEKQGMIGDIFKEATQKINVETDASNIDKIVEDALARPAWLDKDIRNKEFTKQAIRNWAQNRKDELALK